MKKITKTIKGYTFPWYSDTELASFFPEAKELVSAKIKELKNIIREKESAIFETIKKIEESGSDDFSKWFAREIVKMEIIPELQKYDRELLTLKRYSQIFNPSQSKKYIQKFQEKVEIARNYPIYEVASRYMDLKRLGNKYSGLCPIHNEKSASFFIYTESNTYHSL